MAANAPPVVGLKGPGRSNANASGEENAAEVDAEKIYTRILEKKENELAREALRERRAQNLTRHFLRMKEEDEKRKLELQAEKSRKDYECSVKQMKDATDEQALMKHMLKEEKQLIFGRMQQMSKQREGDLRQERETKAEREKWIKARALHEQFEAEKRKKQVEELEAQRLEKIRSRKEKNDEEKKAREAEHVDEEKAKKEKEARRLEAVDLKRKKLVAERREKIQTSGYAVRLDSSEQRRKEQLDERLATMAEASRKHESTLQVVRARDEKALQEKARRLAEKEEALRIRQDESKLVPAESPSAAQDDRTTNAAIVERQSQAVEEKKEKAEEEKNADNSPSVFYYMSPKEGQELRIAHARAQKTYVQRNHELMAQKNDMMKNKRFKNLAEAARHTEDKHEDSCTRHLRAVHNMYIAKTPRDKTLAETSTSSASKSPRLKTNRQTHCALCGKQYPSDSLQYKTFRRIIDKLRHKGGYPGFNKEEYNRQYETGYVSEATNVDPSGNGDSPSNKGGSPRTGLYDYEVRLCATCWHYAKIMNT